MAATRTTKSTTTRPRKTAAKPAAKPAARTSAKRPAAKARSKAAPGLDIEQLVGSLKLPGVDLKQVLDGRREDIRAVVSANRIAYAGMNELAKRQSEILKSAVAEWRQAVKDLRSTGRDDRGPLRTKLAREALERALAEMKSLAETSTRVQTQAWEPVLERFRANLSELRAFWTRSS